MDANETAPYKVLWIDSCSTGVLRRDFLGMLWGKILNATPFVDNVQMVDDDVIILGSQHPVTHLMIPIPDKGKMTGFLELWVDDIIAVQEYLGGRGIPFKMGPHPYNGIELDHETLKENVTVRINQAPEHILETYHALLQAASERQTAPDLASVKLSEVSGDVWVAIVVWEDGSESEIARGTEEAVRKVARSYSGSSSPRGFVVGRASRLAHPRQQGPMPAIRGRILP